MGYGREPSKGPTWTWPAGPWTAPRQLICGAELGIFYAGSAAVLNPTVLMFPFGVWVAGCMCVYSQTPWSLMQAGSSQVTPIACSEEVGCWPSVLLAMLFPDPRSVSLQTCKAEEENLGNCPHFSSSQMSSTSPLSTVYERICNTKEHSQKAMEQK